MIKIELEEKEAQVLLNALAARPYMEVAGLIQRIMEQVTQQQQAPPDADAAV